jgi:acyl-CoA thioesterase-1
MLYRPHLSISHFRLIAATLLSVALLVDGLIARSTAAAGVRPPVPTAYAALGASETYGVGAQPRTQGYAYLVASALRAHPFVDTGIPGATLGGAYDTELSGALTIRPHLCTTFFGFNDYAAGVKLDAFLQELHDLVVTLERARCNVLVIGLPDLSLLPAVRASGVVGVHALVRKWNAGMKSVARKNGAHFLDLAPFSAELAMHPEYVSADGLHPSNAGYARLAAVVVATVRKHKLFL